MTNCKDVKQLVHRLQQAAFSCGVEDAHPGNNWKAQERTAAASSAAKEELLDAITWMEREITILRAELDTARENVNRSVKILTKIHELMYPPPILTRGRKMVFGPGSLEANELLQELSDRIRAIPNELGADQP